MPVDGETAGRSQDVAYPDPNVRAVTPCLRTQMRMPAGPSWEPWQSVRGAPWRLASGELAGRLITQLQRRVAQAGAEHRVR